MEKTQQLKICRECENNTSSLKEGLLCGLTNEKPAFDRSCDKFVPKDESYKEVASEILKRDVTQVDGTVEYVFRKEKLDAPKSLDIETRIELQRKLAEKYTIPTAEKRFKNGAKWFYWIAALSVVNSIILYLGGNIGFIVGLGITQFIDGIIYTLTNTFHPIGLIPNVMFAGIFVLFGYFAIRKNQWAFIAGLVLYGFDSLIFLIARQWLSFGFHIFAGIMIIRGLNSLKKIQQHSIRGIE